jgi:hypothetical protein
MDNPLPDVTAPNTVLFFALTAHIGDGTPDDWNDCWCKLQQLHTPFYNNTNGFDGQVVSMLASSSRVQTRPKPLDFSDVKILSMPSFRREVK